MKKMHYKQEKSLNGAVSKIYSETTPFFMKFPLLLLTLPKNNKL